MLFNVLGLGSVDPHFYVACPPVAFEVIKILLMIEGLPGQMLGGLDVSIFLLMVVFVIKYKFGPGRLKGDVALAFRFMVFAELVRVVFIILFFDFFHPAHADSSCNSSFLYINQLIKVLVPLSLGFFAYLLL